MKIHDELFKFHTDSYYYAIRRLGGDPDQIESKYQSLYDSGEYKDDMYQMIMRESPEEAAVRDAWNEIIKHYLDLWLGNMSRDTVVTMLNAMDAARSDQVALDVFSGLNLNMSEIMYEWNKRHNGEEIYINPDFLI